MFSRLLVLLTIAALAGCGGASAGGPSVVPTAAPLAYSATIIARGGDSPAIYGTLQYFMRHPLAISSPLPVTMTATDSSNPNFAFSGGGDTTAIATVVVAPSPSPSPAATTWQTNATAISMQTPAPGSSPGTPVSFSVTTPNQTDSGHTVSSTVSSPVNQTTTVPVYVYPRFIIAFPTIDQSHAFNASEWAQAASFGAGGYQIETDPANADIYGDGPNVCCGNFHNPGETASTLHYPCGGVWFHDSQAAFVSMTSSQWSNAGTTATIDSLTAGTNASDPLDILLIKTKPCSSGKVVKLMFRSISSNDKDSGPYQISGSSIDGF